MTRERHTAGAKRGKMSQSTKAWQYFMLGFDDGVFVRKTFLLLMKLQFY